MLAISDFTREFPVVLKTDRDCEMPLVVEFISARAPVQSLLDVGAHWSGHHYANSIRGFVGDYVGIDIQPPDSITGKILNTYHTGNVNDFPFNRLFDAVICVSTIEHAGVSTYKADYVKERMALFHKCIRLARKHVWISFPVGQEYMEPGQLAIITEDHLAAFESMTKDFKVKKRFIYSQGPQAGHPWREHGKREVAVRIPYISTNGNQSICAIEIDKI